MSNLKIKIAEAKSILTEAPRISPELFKQIESAVLSVVNSVPEEKVWNLRKTVKYSKDQFTSFVWAVFGAASKGDSSLWDSIRKENVSDQVLETSLKNILKKYK